MALEIERKYLVTDDSYKRLASRSAYIAQGYLCRDPERTVRVRLLDDRGFITVKGVTKNAVREEYEYEVPAEDARGMLLLCGDAVLSKRRWYVDYDGFTWEVDEFDGLLSGLVVAEIELPAPDTSFALPHFIGAEVTGDVRYYNSMLIGASQVP